MPSRPVQAFSRLILSSLGLAVAAALLFGWLAEEVLEGASARFDASVRGAVHSFASPAFTSAMWFFTDMGSVLILSALITAAIVSFWCLGWKRAAVIVAITMAGAGVLDEALKIGFHRKRPVPYFGITAPNSFSFPSGHALLSFAFFATIAALLSTRLGGHWLRIIVWAVAVALIGMIGFSRIYLGVHYPTDVIAGYLTAFIWVSAISHGDRYFRNRRRRPQAG